VIAQDHRGYPAAGAPLEKAPPDGPEQPMIHRAVLEGDYTCRVQELETALGLLREVRPIIGNDDLHERVEQFIEAMS
jgi:hypothetical protein